jgi:hypothetical protein
MNKIIVATMIGVMALGLASDAMAGANPQPLLAIDAQARNAKRACAGQAYASCSAINQVSPAAGYLDAIVVLYDYNEVTGVEYGLRWDAPYFTAWKDCADLYVFTDTGPNSCDVSQVYTSCHLPSAPGVGVMMGWLQIYGTAPNRVDFTPTSFPTDPSMTDCAFQVDYIHTLHSGFFAGATPGSGDLAPCEVGPTATQSTTWGQLKDLYR